MRIFNIRSKKLLPEYDYASWSSTTKFTIQELGREDVIIEQINDGDDIYSAEYGNSNYLLNLTILTLLGIKLNFIIPNDVRQNYLDEVVSPEIQYIQLILDNPSNTNFSEVIDIILNYYSREESIVKQELVREDFLNLSEKSVTFKVKGKQYEHFLNGDIIPKITKIFHGQIITKPNGWLLDNYEHLSYTLLNDICEIILKHYCEVNLV